MALQIKRFEPSNHILKAMLYGKSWSGKTTLASTAPKPLYICSENGLASIADKRPEYVEVSSIADLKSIYEELKKGTEYQSVVIDSISEISRVVKENITQSNRFDMDMRKRGKYSEEMIQIIRDIIRLPYHVVVITHDKTVTDDDGKILQYDIAVQWSAREEIPRYFDVIAYTYIKDGKHGAMCKAHQMYVTKDRLRCLPDPLPLDITEWIKIFSEKISVGEGEVVREIENVEPKEDLTKQYAAISEAIEKDPSDATKQSLLQRIQWSTTLSANAKQELLSYIKSK